MHKYLIRLIVLLCSLAAHATFAADDSILQIAERYAISQSRGLPGEVSVRLGALDPQSRLPTCTSLQAFTPPGSRLWGKSMVGVRCLAPVSWSVLIPVHVTVTGNYVYVARAISAGQTLQTSDLAIGRNDLTTLPTGVIGDPAAAIGKTLKNSLSAGQPLRADQLSAPLLIRQGQTVRLIARGSGFTVSSEGKALNNASEGQVAQVKVGNGQTLSGIVLNDGTIEIVR